jgi:hypothetical protein
MVFYQKSSITSIPLVWCFISCRGYAARHADAEVTEVGRIIPFHWAMAIIDICLVVTGTWFGTWENHGKMVTYIVIISGWW